MIWPKRAICPVGVRNTVVSCKLGVSFHEDCSLKTSFKKSGPFLAIGDFLVVS